MEESNKLSLRGYEFLFRFNLLMILPFSSSFSTLSFKTVVWHLPPGAKVGDGKRKKPFLPCFSIG